MLAIDNNVDSKSESSGSLTLTSEFSIANCSRHRQYLIIKISIAVVVLIILSWTLYCKKGLLIRFFQDCVPVVLHSFIHSGHFYSAPSSPLLLRGSPDYSTDTVSEFHAEAHRQLWVKDLPKVPAWRLERESNPRPSGWKSSSQPRRHHAPRLT